MTPMCGLLVIRPAVVAERLSARFGHGDVHRHVESHLYGNDVHSGSGVSSKSTKTKSKFTVPFNPLPPPDSISSQGLKLS